MIETRTGNVLNIETGIIVHGCNCQGVMGAGIALEIKNRFPDVFYIYDKLHRTQGLKLGEISFAEVAPNKFIINANTQDKCGGDRRYVSYDAVADCFAEVFKFAKAIEQHRGIKLDIVFPAIGSGLAGGDWKIIYGIIDAVIPERTFKKVLYLFNPKVQ